jgi:hypothetical protein
MTTHPQVWIENPIGEFIGVDEGLADFLKQIWAEGYVTRYSCQGTDKKPPYIMFPYPKQAEQFMEQYGGWMPDGPWDGGAAVVRAFNIERKSNE